MIMIMYPDNWTTNGCTCCALTYGYQDREIITRHAVENIAIAIKAADRSGLDIEQIISEAREQIAEEKRQSNFSQINTKTYAKKSGKGATRRK